MMKKILPFVLFLCMLVQYAIAAEPQKHAALHVSDSSGDIVGAFVRVKGSDWKGVTDLEGKIVLSGAGIGDVVEVAMMGYVTQKIKIDAIRLYECKLLEDNEMLEELVVIAYGTAKRKDYTGSVASVRLENSPIALAGNTNALESVKGNVAGLDIGATNSAGGQPSMQMRGQKSISGSNSPLIVLDGVLFCGSLNDLNPGDIASIEVLKDASSAAAFGSRSANGVLMITTKKGTTSKPTVSFSSSASFQTWGNKPVLKSGQAYVDAVMARNETEDMTWMTAQETENYLAGRETDWLDFITRTGIKQDYQVSVSGRADKVRYYMSTAYTDHAGIIKGDDFSRLSVSGKVDTDITSWLNIGMDGAYARLDKSGNTANVQTAYFLSPFGTPYRASDRTALEKYPMTQSDGFLNPLWQTDERLRQTVGVRNNYRLSASALVKCPWVEGLTFRANFTLNNARRNASDFINEMYYVQEGAYDDGSRYSQATYQNLLAKANGTITNEYTRTRVTDLILNYSRELGKHSIDATLVSTRDHSTYDKETFKGNDFSANGNTSLGISGLHKASNYQMSLDGSKTTNIGYLARVMYSYDDRYSFTASYRRDGSSVFGAANKWGNFYSVGGAWIPTSESFFKNWNRSALDRLKIKASWGVNGNQAIAAFGTLSPVTNGASGGIRYEFNGSDILYGLAVSSMGNPELGWEATSSFNTGIESSWLKGRIDFDMDFYYSQTKDQIFSRVLPIMTGFNSMKATMGQVDNIGIESTIHTINVRRGDFTWSSGMTFWLNRNKLVHLYGEDLDGDGREDDDISSNLFIGKSLGVIYGYLQDGIVQKDDVDYIGVFNGKPGNPKYVDLNGDDMISAEDRTILGYSSPSFRLNLSNTLQYKGLELYFLVTGTFGSSTRYLKGNPNAYRVNGYGYATCNMIDIDWWSDTNPSNVYPSASFTSDGRFIGLQNRSFVRLQDISLSYDLRFPWLRKVGISKLMAYVSGKNLLTFTRWVGDDPETGSTVLSATMPVSKGVTAGFNLSF